MQPAATADLRARRLEALRRAGVTQASLAARIGVSRQSVGLVLADHHRSRRVEQAIADACGEDVEALFPSTTPTPTRSARGDAGPGDLEPGIGGAAQVLVPAAGAAGEIESDVEATIRRLSDRVLLALADGRLGADSPAVQAVAAALRLLAR